MIILLRILSKPTNTSNMVEESSSVTELAKVKANWLLGQTTSLTLIQKQTPDM